jgi:hypothetical protein
MTIDQTQQTAPGEKQLEFAREKLPDFMIAEYSEVFQEHRRLRDEGIKRLNFFVTLSTAVLGGLVLLSEISSFMQSAFRWIVLLSIFLLLILGWDVYRYLVSREISSDFNMRTMGRIRRFFIGDDPRIADYFLWNTHDEPSIYVKKRSLSSLITTISFFLSALLAFGVGVLLSFYLSRLEPVFGVGILVFVAGTLLLRTSAQKRIKSAGEQALASMKFPSLPD